MESLRKVMKGFKYTRSMDIKDKYFERADEIAFKRYGVGFYDLTELLKDKIWMEAEVSVHEELQENADSMFDSLPYEIRKEIEESVKKRIESGMNILVDFAERYGRNWRKL